MFKKENHNEGFKMVLNLQSSPSMSILDKYEAAQYFITIIYWTLNHVPHFIIIISDPQHFYFSSWAAGTQFPSCYSLFSFAYQKYYIPFLKSKKLRLQNVKLLSLPKIPNWHRQHWNPSLPYSESWVLSSSLLCLSETVFTAMTADTSFTNHFPWRDGIVSQN